MERGQKDFAFQLYSARKVNDLAAFLQSLAQLGYRAVEGYEKLYADLPRLQDALTSSGLSMPTGHFSLSTLADEAKTKAIARALGIKTLICPYLGPLDRPHRASGWSRVAARLEEYAQRYGAAGFGFAWHNHDYEFKALADGALPLNLLLDGAPSMGWQGDLAWLVRAGEDANEWIARRGERIVSVHIKDMAQPGRGHDENGWIDIGDGAMNWPRLLAELARHSNVHSFVLEHDNPLDASRFARRSIRYLQSLKEIGHA